ncbi:MAG: alanine racemase [Candidatus Faecivicinus sp.]
MRPTVMRISLGTLVNNATALRARVSENVKMLCVVKADAYGHGALPFAKELERIGIADAFAVAIVEEARALREGGVQGMIVILGGGCEDSLREAVRVKASQAVYTPEALEVLEDEACRLGVTAKAHLKVDSGMSRIGVRSVEELEALLKKWSECPHVEMEGCFTHFCVADSEPDFTARQDEVFNAMLDRIRAAGYRPIAHAAASTAMLDARYQHDMVRAGIGLYGSCMPEMGGEIQHAQTLSTRPVRIERIQAGDTVGYGRTYRADRETVVMTLPIGYGDGYPRILSNRADVLVHGRRASIIGRVCMDMLMADITDIPGVTLDDEVVLMGRQGDERITPDELADLAETIPYEIMLGFLPRIPRVIAD